MKHKPYQKVSPALALAPLPDPVPLASPLAVTYRGTEGEVLLRLRDAVDGGSLDYNRPEQNDAPNYARSMSGLSRRQDYALPVTVGFSLAGGSFLKAELGLEALSVPNAPPQKKRFPKNKTSLSLWYLLPDTVYRYTVTVILPKGKRLSSSATFHTADTPLIYSVEGCNNVRDIGGWPTEQGDRLPYGKVIRGAAFDGLLVDYASKEYVTATPRGLTFLRHRLGIRFDCDLRDALPNEDPGPLGPSVKRVGYAAWGYDRVILTDYGRNRMKSIFDDLSNPENYPVYIHCSHGVDRTGTVCFLLEALMGVSLENCLKDYDYSGLFHRAHRDNEWLDAFIEALLSFEGDTLAEKVETYLLSLGITQEQIGTIRQILS